MMRAVLIFLMMCGSAAAQSGNVTGFSDHRGLILPSANFVDENGANVSLPQFFGKPFFLAFAYHSCPQLCGIVLGEFAGALRGVSGHVGMDFDVIVISIDPADTPQSSVAAKRRYVARYGGDGNGWHFLTGDSASIRVVADAAGFNFVFDPIQKQFVHPAPAGSSPDMWRKRIFRRPICKHSSLAAAMRHPHPGTGCAAHSDSVAAHAPPLR